MIPDRAPPGALVRRPRTPWLVALVTIVAWGCSPESPDESGDFIRSASPDSLRDRFIRRGLEPVGDTRREIRNALGPPDSVAASAVPNRHVRDETDSLFRVVYDEGLTASIHRVYDGRELLSSITVCDDRFLREEIVRIGMPWSEVRERIGEPAERHDGERVYRCGGCGVAEEPIFISVRDDAVAEIRFSYYVD